MSSMSRCDVQSDQQKLGRRASHRLRQDPRFDPQNHHHHWTPSPRLPGHEGLPSKSNRLPKGYENSESPGTRPSQSGTTPFPYKTLFRSKDYPQSQTVCPKVTSTPNHPAHDPPKVELHHTPSNAK